jgi:hypothetical protein
MKTKTLDKRLLLKKTTVANLEERRMGSVRGGTLISCNEPCATASDDEACLTASVDGTCHCNTSRGIPCDCDTRLSLCCTSFDKPCCA